MDRAKFYAFLRSKQSKAFVNECEQGGSLGGSSPWIDAAGAARTPSKPHREEPLSLCGMRGPFC